MKKRLIVILAALLGCAFSASAQRYAVSTNIPDWAFLGTMNAKGEIAINNNWSLQAGARYNPWTFNAGNPDKQMEDRKLTLGANVRAWPWTVFTEWYISGGVQWEQYNRGGIWGRKTEEGDAYGLTFGAGYTFMVKEHFNIEAGIGGWAGLKNYRTYRCPYCGRMEEEGRKFFILPNEITIALVYVF